MFGFKNNKIDAELLEKKYLNRLKSDFKIWIQNTYEVLNYEQLECISKFANDVYHINGEELADIIARKPSKYFPIRKQPIPPRPRCRRAE